MTDYVDAVIKIRVPKWQIGERVSIYFPDTMCTWGTCEEAAKEKDDEKS